HAEMMRNCVKPLDKSLARDPRHRSGCAQASARSCKGNRTGAWPTLQTLATIYRTIYRLVMMKSRIRQSLVAQVRYASCALSKTSSKPTLRYADFFVCEQNSMTFPPC